MARIERTWTATRSSQLDENMKLASAVGVNGTPGYVVGEEVVVGAIGIAGLKDAHRRRAPAGGELS